MCLSDMSQEIKTPPEKLMKKIIIEELWQNEAGEFVAMQRTPIERHEIMKRSKLLLQMKKFTTPPKL